jgi:hypothetical protein
MPGNLEALLILPERAYGVKKKFPENPYPTRVSGSPGTPNNPTPRSRSHP